MAHTTLSVTPEHVGGLNATRAVELIAELLRAEARRIGVPTTRVRVSIARINVADGSVDASIHSEDIDDARWDASFIPDERTSLQIKTGDSFKPWQESEIRKELFGDKEPSKDNLADSVRKCLDDEGVYVLVCTGTDPNEKELISAEANLKKAFEQCGYIDAEFDVWGQSTTVGLLESFPALALGVNGNAGARFQAHKVWSSQDQMRHELQITEKHTAFIEGARTELRREDRPVHIRVRGEAGIGKTRLVLETTGADDLKPLVLYFEGPGQLPAS